jgi:hypothetical protein
MSTSAARPSRTRSASGALALAVLASGCLDGLDAPFGSEAGELECSDDRDDRYLSAAGTVAERGIALVDVDPPAAIRVVYDEEPGLGVIGSSQEGEYEFHILNSPAIAEGSIEVVRSSIDEPSGIRLILELERRSLGTVELDSLAGEITFELVAEDQLAGHFEAAFGTLTDQFEGCFHVDISRTAIAPQ